MTEVIQSSPPTSHFPSPSSSSSSPTPCLLHNEVPHHLHHHQHQQLLSPTTSSSNITRTQERETQEELLGSQDLDQDRNFIVERKERERGEGDQLSLVTLLVAAFRRSIVGCSVTAGTVGGVGCGSFSAGAKGLCKMEIGLPTNVRHVAHVTFDRFNGFLGLPVEFEPEVPRRAPSASATVFGVSTDSMQLSFDSRGNSVPTILLMMQRHLYARGGLQAEGIFRINAENSQEEYVRDQLNRGVIPEGIDVHCLAGLIKAWFRELPTGVLDSLSPEQVMQSQSEEECAQLVRLLPPTEAALLDWAINLMADVAQMEHLNKMNARNIAMVFAPNMTHNSDPLTALMYAVQVMNFLKTLIIRTIRQREDSVVESNPVSRLEPSDENGHHSSSQPSSFKETNEEGADVNEGEREYVPEQPEEESALQLCQDNSATETRSQGLLTSIENIPGGNWSLVDNCPCEVVSQVKTFGNEHQESGVANRIEGVQIQSRTCKSRPCQPSNSDMKRGSKKTNILPLVRAALPGEKGKGTSIVGSINSRTELFEAWR